MLAEGVRRYGKPWSTDLKLALVLIEGSDKLVQGQELAKRVEAQQLGQQLQGALAYNGSSVLQPACGQNHPLLPLLHFSSFLAEQKPFISTLGHPRKPQER